MEMPGRDTLFKNGYRYGFNGKEIDNEPYGQGNEYDYGMRIYNPRIGRFLSVDPLQKKYPWLSPYQFASNSPIANVDLDGRENYCYLFNWNDKANGLTCIEVNVQKNQESFWDILFSRDNPSEWTGKKIEGVHVTYNFNNQLFDSYDKMAKYASISHSQPDNSKQADNKTVETFTAVALVVGTEISADAMQNSSMSYTDAELAEGEILFGDAALLRQTKGEGPAAKTDDQATSATNTPEAANSNQASTPQEAYNRDYHYGKTPTKADRKALNTNESEDVGHKIPLVKHYYEGDGNGGTPGYTMTFDERKTFANDRSNMENQSKNTNRSEGQSLSLYSKNMRNSYNLPKFQPKRRVKR